MVDDTKVARILEYWFGEIEHTVGYYTRQNELWFHKSPQTDQEIRELFLDDVESAVRGEFDDWIHEAESTLAYILLLDQFTRNIYRDTAKAFSGDRRALRASLLCIDRGFDLQLEPIHRVFMYLPLEHSEDRNCQNESIEAFEKLAGQQKGELACEEVFESFLKYARRHQEVIQRFGRFPHRNEILGRESSADEIEFLKQSGSRF